MSAGKTQPIGSQDVASQAQEVDPAELSALRGKMVKFASLQLGDP